MNNNDILKNLKIIRTVSIQSNFPLKIQLIEMNKATNEQNVFQKATQPPHKNLTFSLLLKIFSKTKDALELLSWALLGTQKSFQNLISQNIQATEEVNYKNASRGKFTEADKN